MTTPRRFVVTGCARSGTAYAAALFSALGLPCGHEAVFRPGGPGEWPDDRPGESSWLAAPHLGRLEPGAVVLHQVRDPLAVVRSHLSFNFFSEDVTEGLRSYVDYVGRFRPEVLETPDPQLRNLRYWERWNRLVEESAGSLAYRRYRVEDVDAALVAELLDLVGAGRSDDAVQEALAAVPRDTNTWGETGQALAWADLPPGDDLSRARALAVGYGYR